MKNLITLFLFLSSLQLLGNDRARVLEILAKENISEQSLIQKNKELRVGELTGAGRVTPIHKVEALIHRSGIIHQSNIREFSPLQAQSLERSNGVQVMNGQTIPLSQFIGAIISK